MSEKFEGAIESIEEKSGKKGPFRKVKVNSQVFMDFDGWTNGLSVGNQIVGEFETSNYTMTDGTPVTSRIIKGVTGAQKQEVSSVETDKKYNVEAPGTTKPTPDKFAQMAAQKNALAYLELELRLAALLGEKPSKDIPLMTRYETIRDSFLKELQ